MTRMIIIIDLHLYGIIYQEIYNSNLHNTRRYMYTIYLSVSKSNIQQSNLLLKPNYNHDNSIIFIQSKINNKVLILMF